MSEVLRFHFLGTSAGYITRDSNNVSTLMESGSGKTVLFDAGSGVRNALLRQGFDQKEIGELLISHAHGDHLLGLYSVMEGMTADARVYLPLPEKLLPPAVDALRVFQDCREPFAPPQLFPLRPGMEIACACGATVRAHINDHLWMHLPEEFRTDYPSLSFEIFSGGRRILLSGDLGTQANETHFWKLLEEPCDLLILEAAHILPMERMLRRLKDAKIGCLVFTHIFRKVISDEKITEYFSRHLSIPFHTARDGDWIELSGTEFHYGHRDEFPGAMKEIHIFTPEEKEQFCRKHGFPCRWKTIGPFPNPKINGEYAGLRLDPENRLLSDAMTSCSGTYTDLEGNPVRWREIGPETMTPEGLLPFSWIYCGSEMTCYGVTDVEMKREGDYELLWGSDDGCRILIDGKEEVFDPFKRGAVRDQNRKRIHLTKGIHRVIVIVDSRKGGWGIYFRIRKTGAPDELSSDMPHNQQQSVSKQAR